MTLKQLIQELDRPQAALSLNQLRIMARSVATAHSDLESLTVKRLESILALLHSTDERLRAQITDIDRRLTAELDLTAKAIESLHCGVPASTPS